MLSINVSYFDSIIDTIYASFRRCKVQSHGIHDRYVRDPHILLGIARRLDIIPCRSRVIRVTGSKGKGTTSRMIAHILQEATGHKVGLVVSPEEIIHLDRIRVNGVPPSASEFISVFEGIREEIRDAEACLTDPQYFLPFGIFLLIALQHFKDQGVHYYVLECGRGATFDEVGNISSSVSVITSILQEHSWSIGPDIEDIARNKLFIGTNSDYLICTQETGDWNRHIGVVAEERVVEVSAESSLRDVPFWLSVNESLAREAVQRFLGHPIGFFDVSNQSAAFGFLGSQSPKKYFDACISVLSLDRVFMERIAAEGRVVVVSSLPDDKDVCGIYDYFVNRLRVPYYEIALSGMCGHLRYDGAIASGRVVAEIDREDTDGFKRVICDIESENKVDTLYFLGTHTFIRLVKRSYL